MICFTDALKVRRSAAMLVESVGLSHTFYLSQEGEFRPLKEDLEATPPREANPERASVSELKEALQ